jgi:MinD-like ATPase involved in chromosome partitioning or flagellar assembly
MEITFLRGEKKQSKLSLFHSSEKKEKAKEIYAMILNLPNVALMMIPFFSVSVTRALESGVIFLLLSVPLSS